MKKVLAFFGAFNPPTRAHLELADFAWRETGREGVIFVPSRTDYIRNDQGKDAVYSNEEREEMLRRLAESRPWIRVCDWELHQAEQPRTYRTLCHLREEGYEPSLLMGSDKLRELSSGWKHVPEIAREFGIVCLARGKDSCREIIRDDPFLQAISDGIVLLDTPDHWKEISSTAVREILRQPGDPEDRFNGLVPEEIRELVCRKQKQERKPL
jgi:nicotinate (nicotinamide) nucleotide adenylyltransferase